MYLNNEAIVMESVSSRFHPEFLAWEKHINFQSFQPKTIPPKY
jgi:hypothetical protein